MGNMGFFLSSSRGVGPPLEVRWETQVSSQVALNNLGFL